MYSFDTVSKKLLLVAVTIVALTASQAALANPLKHIITFTYPTYTPNTLNVSVGDTIEWSGAFANHPLESTGVPSGAAAFSNSTGTTYDYIVTVPGEYQYQCQFHFSAGMKGSFVAAAAGVDVAAQLPQFELMQNTPNPVAKETSLGFTLQEASNIQLQIFDTKGAIIATLLNGRMSPGKHSELFDASALSNGAYFVRLTANGVVASKEMIVQH